LPQFSYELISSEGRRLKGKTFAEDRHSCLMLLSENDASILSISEIKQNKQGNFFDKYIGVDPDATLLFFSQLKFLLKSGLPLFQSLDMVLGQTEDKRLAIVLEHIRQALVNGLSLSEAMGHHHIIFDDLIVSMILVGEGSGNLDLAFDNIVNVLEEKRALRKKIKKLTNYMLSMIVLGLGVMTGVLLFVFPKFSAIFLKVGATLPASTQVMITVSDFILANKVAFPTGIVCVILAIFIFYKSDFGRRVIDRAKLNIPFVKHIVINSSLAEFTQTLSSLMASGMPIMQALLLTRNSVKNSTLKPLLSKVIEKVREGDRLSDAMAPYDYFPKLMIQLTAAGENSGQLDTMISNVHGYLKEKVDESIDKFTAILQPLMLVVLGSIVLIMALSIFLPMFSLSSTGHG